LTLQARLTGATPQQLELTGQLMVGDQPAADREVTLGRLGETLPTHRLKMVRTDQNGSFTVLIDLESRPSPGGMKFNSYSRVATAFYAGSDAEWSTTAFATLSSEA
jgi:hypothetical protein